MEETKRHLVTAALPYANGPMHIGHLAGVYLPADIYVRFLRAKKEDVIFVSGSDEHGVPIMLKARKEGISPQKVVDQYHDINKKSLEQFGIDFDIFSRTSHKVHHETSQDFFRKLYEKGLLLEKASENFFDVKEQQFLADRYIVGGCPKCENEEAYGDQCEKCGSTLSPDELKNPKSVLSGDTPIKKTTKHWYLPLDQAQPQLKKWIDSQKGWKKNVLGQCQSWFNDGLKPRAITRDLDWGVQVPIKDADGKVLYVWFDAPIGYISATKELTDDWEKYWKDEATSLVHFIGKDNIVFHCIIFPAMLMQHGDFVTPTSVPANEFLNLEHQKISTSKNWAVWLPEYLKEFEHQQDALRYVLAGNMPEQKDNDFTWKDFQTKNNSELVAVFGNFVNRTMVLIDKYFDGIVPIVLPESFDDEVKAFLKEKSAEIEALIRRFKFKEALKAVFDIARFGNKYLADHAPWNIIKTDPQKGEHILFHSLQIVGNLTLLSQPFLPFTAEKMKKSLNLKNLFWEEASVFPLVHSGEKVKHPGLLFSKIEDEQILPQTQKLMDREPIKPEPMIDFEDFQKVKIKVGTVKEVTNVPKSKTLLQLKIDDGNGVRTILSGVSRHYSPEEVEGKQVCFIENLKPRKIMGIESEGMVLFAEDASGLTIVSPEKEVDAGSPVL